MIFIDTTIWVSAADKSDNLHPDGSAVLKALSEERIASAITTDYVIDETLTILRNRLGSSAALWSTADNILSSSLVGIVYVDETLFRDALNNFRKYAQLSFTDSVSLVVMKMYRIHEIYSHDGHFDLKGLIRKEKP